MSKEDYISIEVAKLLKEKGFDEPCDKMYNEKDESFEYSCYTLTKEGFRNSCVCDYGVAVPLLYKAAKWLRDIHQLHIDVGIYGDFSTDADGNRVEEWSSWGFVIYYITNFNNNIYECEREYASYEEALNAGILEALNFV